MNDDIKKKIEFSKDIIELHTKLIDKYKKEQEKPKIGFSPVGNWHFDDDFNDNCVNYFDICEDNKYINKGYNAFETEEEALKVKKQIGAWLKFRHIAKVLNDNWEHDPYDEYENKWYLKWDASYENFITSCESTIMPLDINFKTSALALKAAELMGKDIQNLFPHSRRSEKWTDQF